MDEPILDDDTVDIPIETIRHGWDRIDSLKKDRTLLDIPIIALTAHAMTGDRERAIRRGFHNYLTKPLMPETFVADVLKLLVTDIPELASTFRLSCVRPGSTAGDVNIRMSEVAQAR